VRELAAAARLSPTAQESVILATGETVTNAWVHGRPPVQLRAWGSGAGRLTVAVSDSGPGPHALVGMVPEPPESLSGRGMWLVHLLLADVHHRTDDGGYTVTFSVDGDATDLAAVRAPAAG
jgi:anti-sigma regulatory factor (Ser/Thr protein kinase)